MGKYSNFERAEKDFYPTIDPNAIVTGLVNSIRGKTYAEPCYGEGDLEDQLMEVAVCKWRSDIRKTVGSSVVMDAMTLTDKDLNGCDLIITNPPFTRQVLLPMIEHFVSLRPTWLLLPADLMHNIYFSPYVSKAREIISVGRLYWSENEVRGKQNFCWYFWPSGGAETWEHTEFIGRG